MKRALAIAVPLLVVCSCSLESPPAQRAGTAGSAGNAGQMSTSGSGGMPVTAGASSGGASSGGSAGASTGGVGVVGGNAGTAGSAGTGGSGGSGGSANPNDVATMLEGPQFELECGTDSSFSIRVCNNNQTGGGCPNSDDYILDGYINRDETVTFGGTPGTMYDVTVRVRGVVEPKDYIEGEQGPGGFYVGGRPGEMNNYNVYLLRVSSPAQDYFFNSIGEQLAHNAYSMDYEATLTIEGGATLRFVASDSNCLAIANCAEPQDESVCNPITIASLETDHPELDQPYDGQFIYFDVQSVEIQ